jgi:cyanophycinase-like exopeptidase
MTRALALIAALVISIPALAAKQPYSYIIDGDPADVTTGTTRGTVLMGGGEDVDAAFQWLCTLSGNGDFLVIRATGTDAYNPYIRMLCPGGNSVATLIIPTREAAGHPDVLNLVNGAEALWIAGGDQSNYVNDWQDSPLEDAINAAIARGVPVGGTSAGMNVLTEFVYSALGSKGATSSQALADPFNKYMTFTRDFLATPHLGGVIGDPHFAERDRMGRDLAFLCRMYANGWSAAPRGIAVDAATALLIDGKGDATVVGSSAAYFLQAPGAPSACAPGTPLTYKDVAVYRVTAGTGRFNLSRWSGSGGTAYTVSAVNGVVTSTQPGGSPY